MSAVGQSVNRGVVRGVAYTLTGNYAVRFINLAITVILARSVGPEAMGIVAAALITLEVIDTIRDFGLREALIQGRALEPRYASTAFVVIQIVSVMQALVMAGVGWFGPGFGLDAGLAALLPFLALIFPLSALGSPQEAMLLREGRFGARAAAEVSGTVVKLCVALVLLHLGWGVYSIVAAMVAGIAVRSATLWTLADWRPTLEWPVAAHVRTLMGYGKHIIAVNMMALCRTKGDQFLVASLLGATALGAYFLAARIPEIVFFGVNVAISSVAFPTFARILREGGSLDEAYGRTIRASMLLMAPASLGLAAIAGQVVPLLFGPGWAQMDVLLMLLALGGIPLTLGWSAGDVFKATGRPHLLTTITLIELGFTAPIIAIAVIATRDLTIVAAAMVLCETLACLLRLAFLARYQGTNVGQVLVSILPILGSALVMCAAVLAVAAWGAALMPGLRLLLSIAAGCVVYAGMIRITDARSVQELRNLIGARA